MVNDDKFKVALEKAMKVIEEIKARRPDIAKNFSLVGCWIWYESTEKPHDLTIELLRSYGFNWNGKRKVWQCSNGYLRRKTDGNPKDFYSVISIESINSKKKVESISSDKEDRSEEKLRLAGLVKNATS